MKKQTKVWLVLSLALSLGALGSACTKEPSPGDTNTNAGAAKAKYSGATGTVNGVISFNGTPPAAKKIDSSGSMAADRVVTSFARGTQPNLDKAE